MQSALAGIIQEQLLIDREGGASLCRWQPGHDRTIGIPDYLKNSYRTVEIRAIDGPLLPLDYALRYGDTLSLYGQTPSAPAGLSSARLAAGPQHRLHAALGFDHVGVTPGLGWKKDRWCDVVWMHAGHAIFFAVRS